MTEHANTAGSRLSRIAIASLLSAVIFAAGLSTAYAEKPAIDFRPPDIQPAKVCAQRKSDDMLKLQWSSWDGERLPPGIEYRDLDAELARLRNIDANKYFDTIKKAYNLRAKVDPYYNRTAYLLDMISLYVKAERFADLRETGFVAELEATGPAASAATVNFLGDLYLEGRAVPQNEQRGLQRKLQAAYNGNPNAVLDLAERTAMGQSVPGWDMPPKLAFTLGFSSLLGNLDSGICERVRRIARAFETGEVIAQDHALAEEWYRFAAELGDPEAAWKAARYQLSGDGLAQDDTLLMRYLTQAYEAGIVPARLAMGSLYEQGRLLTQDPVAAMRIYDALAADGSEDGLIAAIRLQERQGIVTEEDKQKYRERLVKLARFPDAPGWPFSRLGTMLQDESGLFAQESARENLFQEAAKRDDPEGKLQLGRLYLQRGDEADRQKAIALFEDLVAEDGKSLAIDDLRNALLCRAPDGPDTDRWAPWQALDPDNLPELPDHIEAEDLAKPEIADALARLQAAALGGSGQAAGRLTTILSELKPAQFQNIVAHWRAMMTVSAGGEASVLQAAYTAAPDDASRTAIFDALKALADGGEPYAKTALAEIYLADVPADEVIDDETLEKATALIEAVGGSVKGSSLWRLDDAYRAAGKKQFQPSDAMLAEIARVGDFEAMLFAAARSADEETANFYYDRALSIMPCDLNALARKARYALDAGRPDDALNALDAALALSPEQAWQQVKLADIYLALGSIDDRKEAYDLYVAAFRQGYEPAVWRLLDWFSSGDGPFYDEALHEEVLLHQLRNAGPAELYSVVAKLKSAPKSVFDNVLAKFDLKDAYRGAAIAGEPVAMRELSKLLMQDGSAPDEAAKWLTGAATAGDPEAMLMLAQSYAFGLGVEPSAEKARQWLQAAASAGDETAVTLLSIMRVQ
ncbi:sel1 repeat family protein [Martelella lutilitoris]|uniref:Sel1 repeat family protein n=1 Tax=Martelella lutilitoris TaxID=2583532 RepID=A0A7T7HLH4_9HYPH|nr:tetratricopeptide repeat protein [Martelella lutilitoris]QQM31302.1 sel1 repeat family protein [Martelella lutilitoris]